LGFAAARAYYAAFYAATAALLSEGMEYQKHSGVIAAIHKFLVKTGKLDKENGKNLNWLFELRSIGDYGDTRHVPQEEAARAIAVAQSFVAAIKKTFARPGVEKPNKYFPPVPLIGIDTWKIKNTNYGRLRRYSVCLAGGDCAGSHLSNFDLLCSQQPTEIFLLRVLVRKGRLTETLGKGEAG
jgi:hypothetical protein